jgi:hypothetical protein
LFPCQLAQYCPFLLLLAPLGGAIVVDVGDHQVALRQSNLKGDIEKKTDLGNRQTKIAQVEQC